MTRYSITGRQRETEAGTELLSLCQTITEDGTLSDDEVLQLREWLRASRGVGLPARDHLHALVEQVLRDGRITDVERRELHRAIEAILPPDLRPLARLRRLEQEEAEEERRSRDRAAGVSRVQAGEARNQPLAALDFMVAGVRYEGRPGTISRHVRAGDPAYLRRDRDNPNSRHAVEVRTRQGYHVGFVPEYVARDIAPLLDAGSLHRATFRRVIGHRYPMPVVGVAIHAGGATIPGLVPEDQVPIAAEQPPPPEPDPEPAAAPAPGRPRRSAPGRLRLLAALAVVAVALLLLFSC